MAINKHILKKQKNWRHFCGTMGMLGHLDFEEKLYDHCIKYDASKSIKLPNLEQL